MTSWLDNFAYRTTLNLSFFIISGIIALLIALMTVCAQVIKTALSNPVYSLRYE
jgi:putative ABC transport system permease protein